jgi:hypothetical protein
MARTKQTAKRKGGGMPPLRLSPRKKKRRTVESPVASPPKKKVSKPKKAASPKTPPRSGSGKASSALAVRSSPRLKNLKKKAPVLPTQARKEARSRAKVVKEAQEEVFPELAAAPSSTSSKGAHFSVAEDEIICKAYVRVSLCNKKGANKKTSTFWNQVHKAAEEMMKVEKLPLIRDMASMKNRFKKINPAVLAFKGMYKIAKKQKVSGWNEDMYEKHALEMWEQNEGSPYMFLECSKVMKDIPKYDWEAKPSEEGEEDLLGMDAPMGGGMVRTMGGKRAKALDAKAKIKKNQSTSVSSVAVDDELMQNIAANFEKHTEVAINMDKRQMLTIQLHYYERQGNQQEADRVFREILDIVVAKPVERPVAMDLPVPPNIDCATINLEDNELVSVNNSSSSSESIPEYRPEGNLKDDRKYDSNVDSDSDDDDAEEADSNPSNQVAV